MSKHQVPNVFLQNSALEIVSRFSLAMNVKKASAGLVGLALIAVSCSSADIEATVASTTSRTFESGDFTAAAVSPKRDPNFNYEAVDYDAEPVDSALRGDRSNAAFPTALVAPEHIVGGGPPPDGIPAIDDPQFSKISEIDNLTSNEAVIAVELNGEAKAYPVRAVTRREIVNDEIGGEPVSVFYCPLCNSAIAFKRTVGDRVLDFGTSGELFQSALVAYDRQTESLWAHFSGEAIIGHYAGFELTQVPAQTVSYKNFVEQFPDGLVLTNPSDGENPYVGYEFDENLLSSSFGAGQFDDRLAIKERVVGIDIAENSQTAVTFDELRSAGVIEPADGVVVFFDPVLASPLDSSQIADGADVGQSGVFRTELDGDDLSFELASEGVFRDTQTNSEWNIFGVATFGELAGRRLETVPHLDTFWFAWSAYNPETALYGS